MMNSEYKAKNLTQSRVWLEKYKNEFLKKCDETFTTFSAAHNLEVDITMDIPEARRQIINDLKLFIEELGYETHVNELKSFGTHFIRINIINPHWNS